MTTAQRQQPRLSVIECLSAGFEMVARRPYLVILPLLVDALLVWGPQLTATPLVERTGQWLDDSVAQAHLTDEQAKQVRDGIDNTVTSLKGWNTVEVATWQVPSLMLVASVKAEGPVHVISSTATLAGVALLLLLAAALLATLYLAPIGALVRAGSVREAFAPLRLARAWARYLAYLGFLLAICAAFVVMASVIIGIASLLGAAGASIAVVLVLGLGLLLYLYLYLAQEAVFVSDIWPLEAARRSIQTVSVHFWGVLGLAVLVIVISWGLGIIWDRIVGTTPGLLGAAVASAFVATGLTASVMVYYWERFRPVSGQPPLPTSNDASGRRSA